MEPQRIRKRLSDIRKELTITGYISMEMSLLFKKESFFFLWLYFKRVVWLDITLVELVVFKEVILLLRALHEGV